MCVYLVAALGITLLERWVLGVAVVAVLVAVTRRVSSGLAVPLTPAAIADTELEALDCLPFAWGDPRKMRPKKNDGGKKKLKNRKGNSVSGPPFSVQPPGGRGRSGLLHKEVTSLPSYR